MVNKRKKNNRITQRQNLKATIAESEALKEPHCMILTRGSVSMDVKRLSKDFQRVMEPNIPAKLKGTKKNSIKDFVSVASQLSLTHLVAFTQTSLGLYVKMCRLPQGPTVTFKLQNFVRSKDVLSTLKKQFTHSEQFMYSPCIMTNIEPNKGELQLQVTARMLLDMFPNITPAKIKPDQIRRCCLFNYDKENDLFDLRHYAIRTVPVDVSKGVKKMMGRKIPDLGRFTDVSEYMTKAGLLSDSEPEDDPSARVEVRHKKARVALKSSIRLTELGPRMTLQVYKVEGGLLGGQVLYHSHVIKSAEEKILLEQTKSKKKNLKEKRKKLQEENVEKKKRKIAEHKRKCLYGMKDSPADKSGGDAEDEDDDAQYYRDEVGEEPDPDFFTKRKRPRDSSDSSKPRKKMKNDFREIKKAQKIRKESKNDDEEQGDRNHSVDKKPKSFGRGKRRNDDDKQGDRKHRGNKTQKSFGRGTRRNDDEEKGDRKHRGNKKQKSFGKRKIR